MHYLLIVIYIFNEKHMTTELNTYWNTIWDVQNQKAWLTLDIANLERQLMETELFKQIQEKKMQLREVEKQEEEIKQNILSWMMQNSLKSLEFTFQKFTIKKNPWTLIIENIDEIPEEFKKEKTEVVVDKKAIKEQINNGADVPWCNIQYSYSLLITPKK